MRKGVLDYQKEKRERGGGEDFAGGKQKTKKTRSVQLHTHMGKYLKRSMGKGEPGGPKKGIGEKIRTSPSTSVYMVTPRPKTGGQ